MPITQATMVELMRESRAAIQSAFAFRHALREYAAFAKQRYPDNEPLQQVLSAIEAMERLHPEPIDKATYRAEYHYRRVGKNNDRQRIRQEMQRRNAGVPTAQEAIDNLNAFNAQRREGADVADISQKAYARFNRQAQEPKKPTSGIIFPREYPEDLPLEFETLADLPKPQDTDLTAAPSFSLDEPEDKY